MSNEQIKPGYKRTEVEVIPEDWSWASLKEVSVLHNGRAYSLHEWERSGVPVIRLQNLTGGDDFYYSTLALAENKYCDFGDLLYMWSATFGPHIWLGGRAIYHYHIWKIEPKETRSERSFLYYKLLEITEEKKARSTNGGTMLHVTKASMEATKIALPPPAEQRAIATALSDVDALLAKLDQLIAKKRDLKQAAMQQLLTGQTRLPGFSGEWEVVKAGDIGQFRGGNGFPVKFQGLATGEYPFFKVSDMNNAGNEVFMETANHYISEAARKQLGATIFSAESIVFAKVGAAVFLERKKILGKDSCLDNNMCAYILDKNCAHFSFIHFLLINTKLASLVSTTALPSLSGAILASIEMRLPPLAEQTAIATVLSDMDAELTSLEARRDKTRTLKQGMMQELLTGRIRLI